MKPYGGNGDVAPPFMTFALDESEWPASHPGTPLVGWRPSLLLVPLCRQLHWVCDDSWKPAVAQSMFFVGSVLGSLGLGVMSDHVGRLPVLILANMLALAGNVATVFTSGLPEFAFCRMVTGLATDNNFVMMYIIGE